MKNIFLALLVGLICIIPSATDMNWISGFDISKDAAWDSLGEMISADPVLLPMIASKIRSDTAFEDLYKCILIVARYRYRNSFYPVKFIWGAYTEELMRTACISYFIAINTESSREVLRTYINHADEKNRGFYEVLLLMPSEEIMVPEFISSLYDGRGNMQKNALLALSHSDKFIPVLIDIASSNKYDQKDIAYSLFFLAPSLQEKALVDLYKKLENKGDLIGLYLGTFSRSGYKKGLKYISKTINNSDDFEDASKMAKERLSQIKRFLSQDWVKDKVQTARDPHVKFDVIYRQLLSSGGNGYDYQELVKHSSIGKVDDLLELNTLFAGTGNTGALAIVEEINSLIFILRISSFYPYILGM